MLKGFLNNMMKSTSNTNDPEKETVSLAIYKDKTYIMTLLEGARSDASTIGDVLDKYLND